MRLNRALKFSWCGGLVGVVLLLLSVVEIDREAEPYFPEGSPSLREIIVMLATGMLGGLVLGWFWNWRKTIWGSAALGGFSLAAFSGGVIATLRMPGEPWLEKAGVPIILMFLLGAWAGALAFVAKRDGYLNDGMPWW